MNLSNVDAYTFNMPRDGMEPVDALVLRVSQAIALTDAGFMINIVYRPDFPFPGVRGTLSRLVRLLHAQMRMSSITEEEQTWLNSM